MSLAFVIGIVASTLFGAEKPSIVHGAAQSSQGERPEIAQVIAGIQGNDLGLILDFNRSPWGSGCEPVCANATIFVDTDDDPSTGLGLELTGAPENGADLTLTIQGIEAPQGDRAQRTSTLRIKVTLYSGHEISVDRGSLIAELSAAQDVDRLRTSDRSVFALIDTNIAGLTFAKRMRLIYHPPGVPAIVGYARGFGDRNGKPVELFKDGKLSYPVRAKAHTRKSK
mgnify:CR=1 FL=1